MVELNIDLIAFTVTPLLPLEIAGYLSLPGGIAAFAGFITIIVSAFMRRKDPPISL